jgi:hypothetical protein
MTKKIAFLFMLVGLIFAGEARAQAPPQAPPPPLPYGPPIGLEDAKKAAAASAAEVAKVGSAPDSIAIVDHGGFLIYFERMENTSLATVEIAIAKARSAALFRRPTKVFEDALAMAATRFWRCMARFRSRAACRSFPAAKSSARSAPAAARRNRTAKWPRPERTRSSNRAGTLGPIRISEF